jgi:long-subunit fatty acid transport protein
MSPAMRWDGEPVRRGRSRGPKASLTIVLVVAALAAPATARASTLDLFGFGIRSPALAGTGAATADDYEAVYANPAGLADAHVKRATVGVVVADFDLRLDGTDIGADTSNGIVLGGVVPMPLGGWAKDRIGLGIGIYVPNDTLNRARAPVPGEPSFVILDGRAHVIAVQFAAGVRLSPTWSAGIGVIALAALRGGIFVTADPSGRFTTQSEQRLVSQFAPLVGARWTPRRDLTTALVARAPSRSDYDITVDADLGDTIPLLLPDIRIAGTAQYDPLTVAAEAAWAVRGSGLTAIAQLAWQRWSAMPLPTRNPVAGTPAQQPHDFHDTVVPRIAGEWTRRWRHAELAVRAGYAFLWSPAPEMRGQQSLLDNHRHLISLGTGGALTGKLPLRFDAYVQLHQLMRRRHVKDPALQPDGEMAPFDAITARGRVVVVGAALGVDL